MPLTVRQHCKGQAQPELQQHNYIIPQLPAEREEEMKEDYKKFIIQMIGELEDVKFLQQIYTIIMCYKRRKAWAMEEFREGIVRMIT